MGASVKRFVSGGRGWNGTEAVPAGGRGPMGASGPTYEASIREDTSSGPNGPPSPQRRRLLGATISGLRCAVF